jgi:hypothetical protein
MSLSEGRKQRIRKIVGGSEQITMVKIFFKA